MISPRDEVACSAIGEHGGRRALADVGEAVTAVRHDFSACLNAYGPADVVRRAIAESSIEEYPDPACRLARRAASERWHLPTSEISFGAGAAELIHAVCFAYLRPGDCVLIAEPAFGEYARAASLCGASVHLSPTDDGNITALSATVERLRPRLVFLATPMSPTGSALDLRSVERLATSCRRAESLLVLDQAYDAFTAAPLGTPALPGHSHVLHLRSLTKDHALAGVRAAFGIGPTAVIDAIERVRVPWAASTAAQAAAVAAMTDEALTHVERTTAQLRAEAARIAEALAARGIDAQLRATHYFVIRCGRTAETRRKLLADAGILVRDCTSFGMPEWIRIAARTPLENDALIAALLHATPIVDLSTP